MRRPLLFPLALLSCGDGLVSEDYQGEALSALSMHITDDGEPTGARLRAAIFWLPETDRARDLDAWVEDRATSRAVRRPQDLTLQLFDTPPIGPHGVAFGGVFVYEDANGDGRRQVTEPIVGQLHDRVVAYAPRALAAAE